MNNVRRLLVALTALMLITCASLQAQSDTKVKWKVMTPTLTGAPGATVELKVQATIASGWHMYTTRTYPDSIPGPQPTEITVGEAKLISKGGKVKGPKAIFKYDEGFEMKIEYWEGAATLTIPVKIAKKATVIVGAYCAAGRSGQHIVGDQDGASAGFARDGNADGALADDVAGRGDIPAVATTADG